MNINYREWEELEDLAYEEVVKTKKKPKRKKKSWKELNTSEQNKLSGIGSKRKTAVESIKSPMNVNFSNCFHDLTSPASLNAIQD